MTLEDFCTKAGAETFDCGPAWGGRIGIRTKGSNYSMCGFRTKNAAYREFVRENCGPLALSIFALLRESEKKQ